MNTENLVIGICDDDLNDLEQIRQALCKCMKILEEEHVTVKGYQSSEKLYEESKQIKFHLLFLDLEMPGENGFELAERLHVLNSEIAIIFVSNHENMVFDSFEYIPMWFVRKSSLERDLLKAVKKYVQTVRKVLIRYRAKEGMEQRWVQMGDVLFIEGSGHNLMMKMIGQEQYQIYGSLKIMEKRFSPLGFVRIHKNYLVNARYVKEVGARYVRLTEGTELDIGKNRRKQIIQLLESHQYGRRVY